MGYNQKFAREESLIFFIRTKEQPDVPFVTIEYSPKQKRVLQCYGYHDSNPDNGVIEFVHKKWLPYSNRKISILNRNINLASTVVDYNVNVAV